MWESFFLYTRREQKGIVVLLSLILIVLVVRCTMPYWVWYLIPRDLENEWEQKVQKLNVDVGIQDEKQDVDTLYPFNPNVVSEEELLSLGFSPYQSRSLIGYRNYIGKIREKEELLGVYGMDSTTYFRVEKFILLSDEPNDIDDVGDTEEKIKWINFNVQKDDFWKENVNSDLVRDEIQDLLQSHRVIKSLPYSKVKKYGDQHLLSWLKINSRPKLQREDERSDREEWRVELNSADTTELQKLHGIGRVLSVRIIKFRALLGGFYHPSQLHEVYGISEELYQRLAPTLIVDTTMVNVMNVDKLSVKELYRHPYVNYEQAIGLKNLYRKNKSPNKAAILQLESMSEKDWERLKHYLKDVQ